MHRLKAGFAALRAFAARAAAFAGPAIASLILLAAVAGVWAMRDRLERHVASIRRVEPQVRFNWPVTRNASNPRAQHSTWLPVAVQRDLASIALSQLDADPFSQASLERARLALLATGWFAGIERIERTPSGAINVRGNWRLPSAVVRHADREYLVAVGGEVLRLPPRTPVQRGSMPVIMNPHLGPPTDSLGVIYGVPWNGGDVQTAIDLLRSLRAMPESARLTGIDLQPYMRTGHLTLVTDAGSRIVWGSGLSDLGPGEVSPDTRRARLRDILQTRFDEVQRSIAIHTPVVLVDKTASAN